MHTKLSQNLEVQRGITGVKFNGQYNDQKPKENKDKRTNTTQKTKDRATRTPLKSGNELK